jgi:hypothetical protein
VISQDFVQYGKVSSFPSTSEGMMLFKNSDGKHWFITEKAGEGASSTVTYWQLGQNGSKGTIEVSKEAQFYFVPNPGGTSIGKFYYPQGMKLSGALSFLFFHLDVDIEIELSKGFRLAASLDPIVLGTEKLFSITAVDGKGGAEVSIATYTLPSAPPAFRKPHFFINGQMTMLGIQRIVYVSIQEDGAFFEISGDLLPLGIVKGTLKGSFDKWRSLDVAGTISAGIGEVNLGVLGTFKINTGVTATARVWANSSNFGASLAGGFVLAGESFTLPTLVLNVNTEDFTNLPVLFLKQVWDFLKELFTDPKKWAEMVNKALGWATDQIRNVLSSVFGLDDAAISAILGVLCPVGTALGAM